MVANVGSMLPLGVEFSPGLLKAEGVKGLWLNNKNKVSRTGEETKAPSIKYDRIIGDEVLHFISPVGHHKCQHGVQNRVRSADQGRMCRVPNLWVWME